MVFIWLEEVKSYLDKLKVENCYNSYPMETLFGLFR